MDRPRIFSRGEAQIENTKKNKNQGTKKMTKTIAYSWIEHLQKKEFMLLLNNKTSFIYNKKFLLKLNM